jgi:ribosomal protein S18 acetylase RimI-like enzyme
MLDYFAPTLADHGEQLRAMARQCFVETFAHQYREDDLAVFLAEAYGPDGAMLTDLADPAYHWRVAAEGGGIAGYVKVGPIGVPALDPSPGALELKQLYVLKEWHGAGVARELMDWAIANARERGAPEIYLSVFDHNLRAKKFYARYGFADVGGCEFRVGNQVDDDRIWMRAL